MKPINNLVHYIWVGSDPIPDTFMNNYHNTIKLNPTYDFKLWRDFDIIDNDNDYADLYTSSSIFHKLQIARYTIMNSFGGLYTDFDIEWKVNFDYVYSLCDEVDLVFPKRNSLYFYNRGQKTELVDDFCIIARPNITKEFLNYCKVTDGNRDSKNPKTDPFSVYALTEWLFTKNSKTFLTHHQIDNTGSPSLAFHSNNFTWDNAK